MRAASRPVDRFNIFYGAGRDKEKEKVETGEARMLDNGGCYIAPPPGVCRKL